jgi:hypothetical protein
MNYLHQPSIAPSSRTAAGFGVFVLLSGFVTLTLAGPPPR